MEGVHVRHAVEGDLEAINRLYNDAVLTGVATWDEAPWPIERRRDWFAEHDEATPILVAEVGGEFAGMAYLSLWSPKTGYRFTREDTIYVEPRFHAQGVGTVLLTALLEEARRLGVHTVIASIESSNDASMALHRKLGFELAGELREAGFKFEAWRGTTYMQIVFA
jgi:phosphinothricin acetyltransferase